MDLTKLTDNELLSLKKNLEYDISKYNNFQLVRKIQLNSAYGAIGNEWFRYYSTELAEAITLSGQLAIQWIGNELNKYINKIIGTENIDYVIASDTDSVYLNMGPLVNKFIPSNDVTKAVNFLDKSSEEAILPLVQKKFEELKNIMNAYENKMFMGREVIANKGIWTAKKRYMLNVYDSEGVRYASPKLKIMGIETTRSSTPEIVRKELKNAIDIILNKDELSLRTFIFNFKSKFMNLSPEEIAFPRTANGMKDYADPYQIYQKSTPIAVKGSLIYNHHIRGMKLDKKYRLIGEGEKIKFLHLKRPNPLGGSKGVDQVVAFPVSLPKEFKLDGYIDYNAHFQKSFLDPLSAIINTIGWSVEEKTTLESLFI
jgi:DNA polymerase elongation subunit (family B)